MPGPPLRADPFGGSLALAGPACYTGKEHLYNKEMAMAIARPKTQTLYWDSIKSPIGECIVMATEAGVCWLGLPGNTVDEGTARTRRWITVDEVIRDTDLPPLHQAIDELQRYFAGDLHAFTCPLDMQGTPFQIAVWQQLLRIPYGESRTYGELACEMGRPAASRAVGAANGSNPIAIIVPCHRVIGSNGSLTGYGGGLPAKAWLLALEGITHK